MTNAQVNLGIHIKELLTGLYFMVSEDSSTSPGLVSLQFCTRRSDIWNDTLGLCCILECLPYYQGLIVK